MPNEEVVEGSNAIANEGGGEGQGAGHVPAAEPSVSAGNASAASEGGAPAASGDAGEPAAYTPNRKFKFTDDDGEKEAEFEDWVGPHLTKDNEEKFRDLFSKAHGLNYVKSKRDKIAQEKAVIEGEYNQTKAVLTDVLGLREKDIGLFLEKVGVSEQQVAKWLLEKAEAQEKLKDLPEPLRNLYNENEKLRRENLELAKASSGAQGAAQDAASQALSFQVQQILNAPELTAVVNDYETRRGQPGAFFEMVRREGLLEYGATGKNLSPQEAVSRALKSLALSQAPSQGATPNGTGAAPKVIIQGKPNVIPNVGGGASTTAQKKPRSIDDLRKLAKEMSSH